MKSIPAVRDEKPMNAYLDMLKRLLAVAEIIARAHAEASKDSAQSSEPLRKTQ